MLRVILWAYIFVFSLVGTTLAQDTFGVPFNPKRPPTQEEIDRKKAADEAYEAAIQKIPDKKSAADPWGTIRPSPPADAKTKRPQQQ